MDIKQIQTFILYGEDDLEVDRRGYEEKLKEESKALYKRLENLYQDGRERDDFLSDISQALVAHGQVYLEIGMKAGEGCFFNYCKKRNNLKLKKFVFSRKSIFSINPHFSLLKSGFLKDRRGEGNFFPSPKGLQLISVPKITFALGKI